MKGCTRDGVGRWIGIRIATSRFIHRVRVSRVLKEIEVLDLEPEKLVEMFSIDKKLNLTIYDATHIYTARKRGYILVTEDTEPQEKLLSKELKL